MAQSDPPASNSTLSVSSYIAITIIIELLLLPLQNALNLTQELTQDNTNQLSLLCQVVEKTEDLNTLNITDFSDQKQIQLEAMLIIAAQVKENICDWVSLNTCHLDTFSYTLVGDSNGGALNLAIID